MKRIAVLLLIVFLVSGCAIVTHGQLPKDALPAPPENKRNVEYQMESLVFDEELTFEQKIDESGFGSHLCKWAEEEFEKSGLFKNIVDVPLGGTFSETDVVLQIKIINRDYPPPKGPGTLFFLTMGLFPMPKKVTWTMSVNIRLWESGRLINKQSFVIKDEMRTTSSLFFIFVWPFTEKPFMSLPKTKEEIIRNMFRHLLIQLHEHGYVNNKADRLAYQTLMKNLSSR